MPDAQPTTGTVQQVGSSANPPRLPIKIHYAYDGFLYFPLFLAEKLGYFPRDTKLVYAKTDKESINQLRTHHPVDNELVMSVCDPFVAGSLTAATSQGGSDKLCIVGAFIAGIPVWLVNKHEKLTSTRSEKDLRELLEKHGSLIHKIYTYDEGTTVNVLTKRFKKLHPIMNDVEVECFPFGKEFSKLDGTTSSENCLVFTSDILRVRGKEQQQPDDVVYSYGSDADPNGLSSNLFTAVVTRESMLEKFLPEIIAVLNGMRAALTLAQQSGGLSSENLKILLSIYDPPPDEGTSAFTSMDFKGNEADKLAILKRAVHELTVSDRLYRYLQNPPSASELGAAWIAAESLWKNFGDIQRERMDIEEHSSPIPCLLIQQDWRGRLYDHYSEVVTAKVSRYKRNRLGRIRIHTEGGSWLMVLVTTLIGIYWHYRNVTANPVISGDIYFRRLGLIVVLSFCTIAAIHFARRLPTTIRECVAAKYDANERKVWLQEVEETYTLFKFAEGIFLTAFFAYWTFV